MKTALCILLGTVLATHATPPVVTNVRAAQRPGTKLVDIYYDVADADGDSQLVRVAISANAGITYEIPCNALTGAVGGGVTPGANKHIVWDAGADWNGNWVPECRARVTAFDGTTLPAPPGMVYIPAGPFQMGDNLDSDSGAMPYHTVQVAGFNMDKTEVSKELWQLVQTWGSANGYSIGSGSTKGNGHPVQTMTWYDAVKWCNARSQREGLTPCYYTDAGLTVIYKSGSPNIDNTMVKWTANGYRLPTEAEWEKAARGGVTGRRFPWGTDTITHSQANYYSASSYAYDISPTRNYHPTYGTGNLPHTSPVGSFAPNGYGLYDMAGNVWEWCWDWHSSSYYGSPDSLGDPYGPVAGSYRVLRGGSFSSYADSARCANRTTNLPNNSNSAYGFRSVRR